MFGGNLGNRPGQYQAAQPGTSIDPPASLPANNNLGHSAPGQAATVQYSDQVITGANIGSTGLSPPAPGMYLVNIRILTGVGPGVLKISYAPPALACFPFNCVTNVAATGVAYNSNVLDYPVNWYLGGTSIAAANFSIVGKNPTEVVFTYCNQPGKGPAIASYRGSTAATLTSSAASTVTNTITFEVSPSTARSSIFLIGWGSGTLTGTPDAYIAMPAVGPFTQYIYGANIYSTNNGPLPLVPLGYQAPANTLVGNMTTTSLGGATTVETIWLVYY